MQGLAAVVVDVAAAAAFDPARGDLDAAGDAVPGEARLRWKGGRLVEKEAEAVSVDEDRQQAAGPAPVFKIDDDFGHSRIMAAVVVDSDFLAAVASRR